jgi:hypothetical protein
MSETGMRSRVVRALRSLDAIGVENPVYPGTPDVNYVEGWLELKWLRAWPVNPNTVVTIEHYTQQQRIWIYRRWCKGGRVHLLLQVQKEWLLFNGRVAYEHLGRVSQHALYQYAEQVWKDGLQDSQLVKYLEEYEV